MAIRTDDYKGFWLYVLVAYAFSWVLWVPNALIAHGFVLPEGLTDLVTGPLNPAAFGPLFSAFLLTSLRQGRKGALELLKRGGDLSFKKTWLIATLLLPSVLFGGSVCASILAGAKKADLSVVSDPPYAVIGFFVILFTAGPLQEEFGWRGYALPRLQSRFDALRSSVILGFFWWLWHLPAVFIPGRFMADDPVVFLGLLVVLVLASVLFTWIHNNTNGSILAAILTHTSMNWSIWLGMPDMRLDLPTIGFMSAFLAVAAAVIIWRWGAARLSRQEAEPLGPIRARP